jgi:hypothetical protein
MAIWWSGGEEAVRASPTSKEPIIVEDVESVIIRYITFIGIGGQNCPPTWRAFLPSYSLKKILNKNMEDKFAHGQKNNDSDSRADPILAATDPPSNPPPPLSLQRDTATLPSRAAAINSVLRINTLHTITH